MYRDLQYGSSAFDYLCVEHFGIAAKEVPSTMVITPRSFDELVENFTSIIKSFGLSIERVKTEFDIFGSSYLVGHDLPKVLFSVQGVGAVHALANALLLCKLPNLKNIIFWGIGGGVAGNVKWLDVNLPVKSIRGDRVTEEVLPLAIEANSDAKLRIKLNEVLNPKLEKLRKKVWQGVHYTIVHLHLETLEMLNDLRKKAVVSIDMELSVYLCMLGAAGKSAIGVIVIDDRPLDDDFHESSKRKEKSKNYGDKIQLAILESILEVLELKLK